MNIVFNENVGWNIYSTQHLYWMPVDGFIEYDVSEEYMLYLTV